MDSRIASTGPRLRSFTVANRVDSTDGSTHGLPRDQAVDIGRAADIPCGVDPLDLAVSRIALSVVAGPQGWQLTASNKRGIVMYPWAQPPQWLQLGARSTLRWPRVALRLIGTEGFQHWVHLDNPAYLLPTPEDGPASLPERTTSVVRPAPLTDEQLDALIHLFAEYMAWPPNLNPQATALSTVARHLKVSPTAISDRLGRVVPRAHGLGAHAQTGVTDPHYFHILMGHGYVPVEPPPF